MSAEQSFVIVGGGLAGASAAATLREEGFEGRIRLLGVEAHRPYIRPPLSKGYLAGSDERESVFVHPGSWYEEQRIELSPATEVIAVGRTDHVLTLREGEPVPYDRLLLATGSSPRHLAIEGEDLAGIHYLRTIDDSAALHAELENGGKRLVLIGSGWIGMEAGATARTLGNEVTILERGAIPLSAALGDELGTMFAKLHKEHGVVLRDSVVVTRIVGAEGRVTGVEIEGGEIVPADLVLVGIGATPNDGLAKVAGLDVDNGILVDASLRSSDPDIFAAGDVANAVHPLIGQRLRSEHWANALNGGPVAARSMLGHSATFDAIPYFYTDQFELGMEYSGFAPLTRGAAVVYRGNRAGREFLAFWIADGRVVAGMNVNIWDVNEQVQRIIREGAAVDLGRLTDTDVPLESV